MARTVYTCARVVYLILDSGRSGRRKVIAGLFSHSRSECMLHLRDKSPSGRKFALKLLYGIPLRVATEMFLTQLCYYIIFKFSTILDLYYSGVILKIL